VALLVGVLRLLDTLGLAHLKKDWDGQGVDGPVQILPPPAYLDVGLVPTHQDEPTGRLRR